MYELQEYRYGEWVTVGSNIRPEDAIDWLAADPAIKKGADLSRPYVVTRRAGLPEQLAKFGK